MRFGTCIALFAFMLVGFGVPCEEVAPTEEPAPDWWDENTNVSGTLEIETAIQTRGGDFQKFDFQLQPELEMALPRDIELTFIPRLRWDPVDKIWPGTPPQTSTDYATRSLYIGNTAELEVRELYIEMEVRETYLTLGKQQVVWGQADGLKVLDVVNPQDFREFILDDFDDSRIPLWMANVEIPVKDANLQLLWIPDQTYHRIPPPGATYEFESNVPQSPPGVPVTTNPVVRPDEAIADSDIGARLSAFVGGWDLSLNYLYQYDNTPVLFRTVNPGPSVTVNPTYERVHVLGGSFSNAFGDLTLRGEAAFTLDGYQSVEDVTDTDGVHQTDEFAYVLGFDWFGISETFLSLQFFQSILFDDAPGLLRDQVENNLTFLARRDFMNDTVELSALWIQSINHGDGILRPKISYLAGDNLDVWAGIDYFYGSEDGIYGQYKDETRIVLGMEIGF